MAKTPALLRYAIEKYAEAVDHTEELIRVKTTLPVENQALHVREGTVAEWEARLTGQWVMLEQLLHHAHCYAGYMMVGPKEYQRIEGSVPVQYTTARHSVPYSSPDYREWRRVYFTK